MRKQNSLNGRGLPVELLWTTFTNINFSF